MPLKLVCAAVAVALMLAFLLPMVVKLREVSLGVVVLIALVMMLVDLRQSLRANDD